MRPTAYGHRHVAPDPGKRLPNPGTGESDEGIASLRVGVIMAQTISPERRPPRHTSKISMADARSSWL